MLEHVVSALPPLFLYLARLGGLVAATPGLSTKTVPAHFKIALIFSLSVVLFVALGPGDYYAAPASSVLIAIPMELAVGLLLGFSVRLLLAAVEVAGEFLSFQMGYAAAAAFDPSMGGRASPPTRLFYMVTLMLFFVVNGHHQVIRALVASYGTVPVGAASLTNLDPEAFLEVAYGLFNSAIRLAFPFILVMLMINFTLAFMARFLPQMNVFILGFALTLGVGFLTMAELMPSLGSALVNLMEPLQAILATLLVSG